MAGERYVVLGLAQARSSWFRAVAQWANSASIPAEFVKCVSAEELRARLASGRPFSALLIDSGLAALDRDLVDVARRVQCAVIVIDDRRTARDWESLGVQDVLPDFFDRKTLLDSLAATAVMIRRGEPVPGETASPPLAVTGSVAAVCGSGGTGASTIAIALAQGLADEPRYGGAVLLADLALHAEQAMLHDARDVVPGVQELVDAHRAGRPSPSDIRAMTFIVEDRQYSLLLGLRKARGWSTIRPRAFEAAFASLRQNYRVVVCDIDAEFEGEDEGGSVDVEERHLMARTAAASASVVFAVGVPGMKGLHSLVRVIGDLSSFGVPAERIMPVVNRASSRPRVRAEITATLASLTGNLSGVGARVASPIFVPERRVDELLRDGVRLKPDMTMPLSGAFTAVARRAVSGPAPVPPPREGAEPERVAAGSLGVWASASDDESGRPDA